MSSDSESATLTFSMLGRLVEKRVWAPTAEQLCTVVANCGLCDCKLAIADDDVVVLRSVMAQNQPSIDQPAVLVKQLITNVLGLIKTLVLTADLKLDDVEKLLQLLCVVASDWHWRDPKLLSIARICTERLFEQVALIERDDLLRRIQDFLHKT